MLTYLSLHLNRWKKRPVAPLLLLLFPLICMTVFYPYFKNTAEQTAVPIGIVNEDNSVFSELVLERMADSSRVRLMPLSREAANEEVQRGDMEAAFVIEEGFQETIQSGEIKDTITWLRSEDSLLDVFAKEALGAELMRLALNSKAGNAVELAGQTTYDEAFQYSDSFWEPNPLFQMSFEERSPLEPEIEILRLQEWQVTVIQLVFLYAWILSIFYLRTIQLDVQSGRLKRILLIQKSAHAYFAGHFIVFLIISLLPFALGINALFYFSETPMDLVQEWNLWALAVFTVTLLLTWSLFMGMGKKRWSLMGLVFLAIGSFTLTAADIGWSELWPHYWLTQKP
ncbi:ABC transporter permease [Halobacillus massiliensis]|uniref:ABC transporter permease n=1 Tax=Halobacillus massiliensis TaxID=1926286 RepID=UPI0009E2A5AD|nr:ABC transporter permease [Halobacillus massiliensis]